MLNLKNLFMIKIRFFPLFISVFLCSFSVNGQENSIRYNDTLTKKFYNLKKWTFFDKKMCFEFLALSSMQNGESVGKEKETISGF